MPSIPAISSGAHDYILSYTALTSILLSTGLGNTILTRKRVYTLYTYLRNTLVKIKSHTIYTIS